MVQRKVPNKLGIQADRFKTERLLVNLKPSSLQHQDVKNGGVDLKKKMKKTGLIKRPELDSRQVKQQRKPPQVLALATLQNQSPAGAAVTTPNYMRSTTSSIARKEQLQVSPKGPQTSPDNSSLRRKSSSSSKLSLASDDKATKTLVRTTSLKITRTLTKAPRFKPARALVKNCAPSVLCENLEAQRATCSSTLKDCKFPSYLELSPGGTESEGTSAMKVCPYTYCSLNGHHHAPLAPLKCFLSVRRRMLKMQRSIKLGCLSPKRARPIEGSPYLHEKLPIPDHANGSIIDPLIQEDHNDFFIEIFHREKEDTTDLTVTVEGRDQTAAENHKEAVEMLSHGPMYYDIDSQENLEQTRHLISIEKATAAPHFHEENQEFKIAEEVSPPLFHEAKSELLSNIEIESMRSVGFSEVDSESSDMDWETGCHSPLYLGDDREYPPEMEKEDPEGGEATSHGEFITKLDNRLSCCFDEFLPDEASQESFDEENFSSDALSSSDNCEYVGSYEHLENLNNVKTSAPEEPEAASEDSYHFLFEGSQTPVTGSQFGEAAISHNIMVEEEISLHYLNDEYLSNENAIAVMGNQVLDLLDSPLEEMVTCSGKAISDTTTRDLVPYQTSSDEGHWVQTEDHLSDEYQTKNTENQGQGQKDCKHPGNFSTVSPMDPAKEAHSEVSGLNSSATELHIIHEVKTEKATRAETDISPTQAIARCKKPRQESVEVGHFNPRAPNFLPLEPDPEAEKVDLRHKEPDERKNTEEWMVDYALRQAVTKLGPARKRGVALLVEAFEKVMPTTKCELHQRHSSVFHHARPIQACS